MIYLDYAATTPISEKALEVYIDASKNFYGNSSSLHDEGSKAAHLLDVCRSELADLLHCDKKGLYFTAGGSESNILAMKSLIEAHQHKGNHLITTKSEHSSVTHFFKTMESNGFEVTYIPVDKYGVVDLDVLRNSIKDSTILAAIQYVNSEIGTIQPIREIGQILRDHDVLFHCDAVQAFGKIPIKVDQEYFDSLSISSHKIYGPKGVGAVYINPKRRWIEQFPGTTHEKGFRPGTVNVPGIASFIAASSDICDRMDEEGKRLEKLRGEMIEHLMKLSSTNVFIEGHPTNHLPNILGIRIHGIEGQYSMLECNRYGIAISTGSACSVGKQAPSSTMKAIGRTDEEAKHFIRFSFGHDTSKEDIDQTIQVIQRLTENYFLQS